MTDGVFNRTIFNDSIFNIHAGLLLIGTHPTQAFFTGRPQQLIPVEFTFILKAGIIVKFTETFEVKSALLENSLLNIKVKSPILVKTRTDYEVYGYIIEKTRSKFCLKASYIPAITIKNEKIKKLLLEKLTESIIDG